MQKFEKQKTVIESVNDYQAWQMPFMDESIQTKPKKTIQLNGAELEVIKKAAFDKAYQEAKSDAEHHLNELKNNLNQAIRIIQNPIELVDKQVEQEILNLVLELTKICVQAELTLKPELITGIIENAKSFLPIKSSQCEIYLNPEDFKIFEALNQSELKTEINFIKSDNSLSRGEVRLKTEYAEVNASVESRLKSVCEVLFHGAT